MNEDLEDFEVFLENEFDAQRFGNDLIKATNTDDSATELDIDTPIKKINYDIGEVDTRIEKLINDNPLQILDQISRTKTSRATVRDGLKPSLDYLDMSYKRLQEVLDPYEKAQKLQSVLSKVHQTSMLLRDALIYIHLVNSIKFINETTQQLNPQRALELASLHSQLQLGINQSANLKSLRLIKKFDTEVVGPSFKELLTYLSTELNSVCSETDRIKSNRENVMVLLKALHSLSSQEFATIVQRIVSSHIQSSVQALVKTINFVKSFPPAMEITAERGHTICFLQSLLRDIKSDNTNLLNEYTSQMKPKPLTPREFYWNQVSSGFKKDLDVSYRRGGPVGKVLQKSREFIEQTIRTNMPNSVDNTDYEDDMQVMLNSVAILSTEIH
ncbi:hypothetical protein ZYGR_0AK00940 [Zygosaccharomyces rouxii]|uniref:Conserved oligomeric Golgi complex subunit 5 n=1 Tax=Zygosaccharomyces rouxii TaxID=4956 RepID=A0A1Q3AD33_ZYGRO|nr:hypothetical protein ZYGR_0AK00940 [Zygosaccharomyces rouxii]